MDAVIFIVICLVFVYTMDKNANVVGDSEDNKVQTVVEDVTRVAILNETFYEDEDAFMEIAHILGFPKEIT